MQAPSRGPRPRLQPAAPATALWPRLGLAGSAAPEESPRLPRKRPPSQAEQLLAKRLEVVARVRAELGDAGGVLAQTVAAYTLSVDRDAPADMGGTGSDAVRSCS